MSTEFKKAVAYCRVKIGKQNEQTIELQKNIISQYAKAYGYSITNWYFDEIKPGEKADRPEFQRMMDDVKNGKIRYLIVSDLDRLTKSVWDFARCIKTLEECECSLVSILEKIDDSPEGQEQYTIAKSLAEYLIKNHAEETRRGIANKKTEH